MRWALLLVLVASCDRLLGLQNVGNSDGRLTGDGRGSDGDGHGSDSSGLDAGSGQSGSAQCAYSAMSPLKITMNNVAVGDTLVGWAHVSSGSFTVSDVPNGAWTQLGSCTEPSPQPTNSVTEFFYRTGSMPGSIDVSVTDTTAQYLSACVAHFSGTVAADFDHCVAAGGIGSAGSVGPVTVSGGGIVFAATEDEPGSPVALGSGFTLGSSDGMSGACGYLVAGGLQSMLSASMTFAPTGTGWNMVIASFVPGAQPGTQP